MAQMPFLEQFIDHGTGMTARCQRVRPNGVQCQGKACDGQKYCRMHGGSNDHVRASAKRRKDGGIDVMSLKVNDFPLPEFLDIETAALEQLAQFVRLTNFVGAHVAEFDVDKFTINDSEIGARITPMVELLRSLLTDANRLMQAAMKLRLEDRRVRIEEERQRFIVGVIVAALNSTPMPDTSREQMRQLIAAGLRDGRPPSPELSGASACGTEGGRAKHRSRGEDLCDACRENYNEQQARRDRAKKAAYKAEAKTEAKRLPVIDVEGVDVDPLDIEL